MPPSASRPPGAQRSRPLALPVLTREKPESFCLRHLSTPKAKLMARVGEEFPLQCLGRGDDIRLREDGRQEPAYVEPEVRKREKARMASPA
ncbi:MAG: hypothetical protein ACKOEM_07555 [Planctomycetia bacterium]